MSENLEMFYDIKAMFVDACKDPQFNTYSSGIINSLLGEVLNIVEFNYNYNNRYFEITVIGDEQPIVVVGKIKSILSQFIYSCTDLNHLGKILNITNSKTFNKFCNLVKNNNQIELFKITNYMYSVLFMGNNARGHLFRIMM